ncbi:MAG: tail fiber domain-containing protein [Ahniella sp.]|nr:tail fiber domain-containing protein [Ahniella sp.]
MRIFSCSLLLMGIVSANQSFADDLDGRPEGWVAPAAPILPNSPMPPSEVRSSDTGAQPEPNDQVIPDDLIVQGSGCFGFDCVINEDFGSDTLMLKENNLRIFFNDTSAAGGFPGNDWRLVANDQASGGSNRFSIEDATNSKIPFTVMADAPTDSLRISPTGLLGLRTASPILDLHMTTGNTPAIRMEQTSASGFSAQTWDIAGNEANFFIRDVTSGSRLAFRIRPGTPTSGIDLGPDGVSIFGSTANARMDIYADFDVGTPSSGLRVTNPRYGDNTGFEGVPEEVRFNVDSDGNVTARGAITQLSSQWSKENMLPVDGRSILERLSGLPLVHWNYIGTAAAQRHLGPTAEAFYEAFGLGATDNSIALSDLAGVALAAVQELDAQVRERDAQLAAQELRMKALEERLARLESTR